MHAFSPALKAMGQRTAMPSQAPLGGTSQSPARLSRYPGEAPAHIQTKRIGANRGEKAVERSVVDAALRQPGNPLDPGTRAFMEARFGHDFGNVRVHSNAAAATSAAAVHALAFTVGRDMVFGAGQYAPGTHDGRHLIAHELTHVLQQAGTSSVAHPRGGTELGGIQERGAPPDVQRQGDETTPQQSPLCETGRGFPEGQGGFGILFDTGSAQPQQVTTAHGLLFEVINQVVQLWNAARQRGRTPAIRLDGFAAVEDRLQGHDPAALSCRRAEAVHSELRSVEPSIPRPQMVAHGETDRWSPNSNKLAVLFIDDPAVASVPDLETRRQSMQHAMIGTGQCTPESFPELVRTQSGALHLDVGGEGLHAGVNNVNPLSVKSCGSNAGQPIPNHVCGVGEALPVASGSVDRLIAESIPMTSQTFSEFARVVNAGSTLCIHSGMEDYHTQLRAAVGARFSGSYTQRTIRGGPQTIIVLRAGGSPGLQHEPQLSHSCPTPNPCGA